MRLGELLADVSQALRCDVLFLVNRPDLVLPLVDDARVFGLFDFDLQFVQLAGQPRGGLRGGFIAAAEVFCDVAFHVGIDNPRRHFCVRGFETNVQQPAVGHAFYAERPQKRAERGRALLVGECRRRDHIVVRPGRRQAAPRGAVKPRRLDGAQGECFTQQDLGLRLNIIVQVGVNIVSIGSGERQDVCVLAVDFHARGRHEHRLRTECTDGHNRHNREEKRKDQPLVLAKNDHIVEQVGFPGRHVPHGHVHRHGQGRGFHRPSVPLGHDFVQFIHVLRWLSGQTEERDSGPHGQSNFSHLVSGAFSATFGNEQNVAGIEPHIFGLVV